MDINLTINTDNAAFEDHGCGGEVKRLLRVAAQDLSGMNAMAVARELDGKILRDINGNTVGKITITT